MWSAPPRGALRSVCTLSSSHLKDNKVTENLVLLQQRRRELRSFPRKLYSVIYPKNLPHTRSSHTPISSRHAPTLDNCPPLSSTTISAAMHVQGKLEERNAGYWRIATTLNQEIPPAWVTHAARKRAKRAKAAAAAAAAAAREELSSQGKQPPPSPPAAPWLPAVGRPLPPRGPFGDRVDRVFFFGDLNYRVDLSREDLELGVSVCRREQAAEGGAGGGKRKGAEARRRIGGRFRPGE